MMKKKNVEYYMNLPYAIELQRIAEEEGGGFYISIPLLKGCMTDGETIEEAYGNLQDAQREWIENMLERKMPIPEPKSDDEYSGRFVVRVPKYLHRLLTEKAKSEGISLNQYISTSLGYLVGKTG